MSINDESVKEFALDLNDYDFQTSLNVSLAKKA